MPIEKPNKLVDLSIAFAVEILNLVKYLKEQRETIICNVNHQAFNNLINFRTKVRRLLYR